MTTHSAVVTASVRGPLEILQVPTPDPGEGEVQVRVEWTASTPLDLHQNDGGLLVNHPQILGDGVAGIVVRTGPGVKNLTVGDKVFGFTWRTQKEKAHQEFCTAPEYLLGKIPDGFRPEEAVTLGNNFVTVFHTVTVDLELPLPWPVPSAPPKHANDAILIWGGSSSVGQFALQILRHWGYTNLLATASPQHHELLKSYGATHVFDYKNSNVVLDILNVSPQIPFIIDCIGSKSNSLAPLAKIAWKGARVAVLLPVIAVDASETTAPVYEMDVKASADWAEGVDARGVRTHFYLQNEFFKNHLQPKIMPELLRSGAVKPNRYRIIEGKTLLERAQAAMDALRRKEASGERLVWRVSE
ncbi:chaperonin 10-like protein [Bisporella sp. PMI_857]|nr:chaperonin 10-like protein [Bisporella sp. PMI_857]